jgi:hypothetical protein
MIGFDNYKFWTTKNVLVFVMGGVVMRAQIAAADFIRPDNGFYYIWLQHPFDDPHIFQICGATSQELADERAMQVFQQKFDDRYTITTSFNPTTPARVAELSRRYPGTAGHVERIDL